MLSPRLDSESSMMMMMTAAEVKVAACMMETQVGPSGRFTEAASRVHTAARPRRWPALSLTSIRTRTHCVLPKGKKDFRFIGFSHYLDLKNQLKSNGFVKICFNSCLLACSVNVVRGVPEGKIKPKICDPDMTSYDILHQKCIMWGAIIMK